MMYIGIDGRRNFGSGIGRVTSNIIKGLLEFDSINKYLIFVNQIDEFKKSLVKNRNGDLLECKITFFSKEDIYNLPKLISKNKID